MLSKSEDFPDVGIDKGAQGVIRACGSGRIGAGVGVYMDYKEKLLRDQLANTPEHTFSLFTTYDLNESFSFGGGAYYVSDSFGGNQGGAGGGGNRVYAPAYWKFDLYAAYRVRENLDLQLNIKNVGDEEYIAQTNGVHHADYGPGRQAILTLNYRF